MNQTDAVATADPTDPTDPRGLSRRRVLQSAATVGVIGVAGTVLAACGGDDTAGTTPTGSSGGASTPEGSASSGGDAIATTADVPVNGGLILESPAKIVLTQPADGDFKAFTAVCTHQGCTVGEVVDNVIKCPCHGSTYDASTGEVTGGPAPRPLDPIEITVDGDQIALA